LENYFTAESAQSAENTSSVSIVTSRISGWLFLFPVGVLRVLGGKSF
jgi:hypothetical protein